MAQPAAPGGGAQQQQEQDGRGPVAPGKLFTGGFSWTQLRPCESRPRRKYSAIVSATAGRTSRTLFDEMLDGRRKKVIQNSSIRAVVPGVDMWSYEALIKKFVDRTHPTRPDRNRNLEPHRHDWARHPYGFWKKDDTRLSAVFHHAWYDPTRLPMYFQLAADHRLACLPAPPRICRQLAGVCSFQDICNPGEVGLDFWRVMPSTGDFVAWIPPMTVSFRQLTFGEHCWGEIVIHGSTATMRDVRNAALQMSLWSARLDPGHPLADRNRLPSFPPYKNLKVSSLPMCTACPFTLVIHVAYYIGWMRSECRAM